MAFEQNPSINVSTIDGANATFKITTHGNSFFSLGETHLNETQMADLEIRGLPFRHDGDRKVVSIGYDYLFWEGGGKICALIKNISNVTTLGDIPKHVISKQHPPIINLTLNCENLMSNTGNWITAIYHLRLASALGRVDFQFQCSTGMALVGSSMLPWLSGYFAAPSNDTWPYDLGWPDPKQACTKDFRKLPLQHLSHEIQKDMRRISVAMLGRREVVTGHNYHPTDTSHNDWGGLHNVSKFLNRMDLEVDDAAIHFRCGDVFGLTNKDVYGLIKFREYVVRIPNETTRSIGIYTQPFDVALLREADRGAAGNCRKIVGVLVHYLQKAFPAARIIVRNTPDDTIPLTYARLTMASQTITSMSTFGIFPAIATFGQGYYQKSGRQNRFASSIPSLLPNFHEMDGPMMSSPSIRKAKWDDIVKFLTE